MELATRKRYHSTTVDASAPKIQAIDRLTGTGLLNLNSTPSEVPFGFADIMTVNLLNTLNNTESSQKMPLLDDLLARIQWLKQQHLDASDDYKKSSSMTFPRQNESKDLTHKQMQSNIQKQVEMLQKMSKLINITAQMGQPHVPDPAPPLTSSTSTLASAKVTSPPPALAPVSAPVTVTLSTPSPVRATPPALSPIKEVVTLASALAPIVSARTSPARTSPVPSRAAPTAPTAPTATAIITATKDLTTKRPAMPPPLPVPKKAQQDQLQPSSFPRKLQTPEELMMDLEQKQRKLLSYISSAHNGVVTDEVLHEYLRHPYVLLKENGVVRHQPNPFFHLMAPASSPPSSMVPPPPPKMLPPKSSRRSATPIPAPPVLHPQVEIPAKHSSKKENTPVEKLSPPPQLPLQVPHPIQIAIEQQLQLQQKQQQKPFEPPTTRQCNQWSVFSMALPLRLMCNCYPMPCSCPK